MHKLLQIRPTTSELQQVVLMIHDMSRRVQDGVREVSSNIRGLVQDKVAEEIAYLRSNIYSNSVINIPVEIFDACGRFSNSGKPLHNPLKYQDKLEWFQSLCLE